MYKLPPRSRRTAVSVKRFSSQIAKALKAQGLSDFDAQLYALGRAAELQSHEDETVLDFPAPKRSK